MSSASWWLIRKKATACMGFLNFKNRLKMFTLASKWNTQNLHKESSSYCVYNVYNNNNNNVDEFRKTKRKKSLFSLFSFIPPSFTPIQSSSFWSSYFLNDPMGWSSSGPSVRGLISMKRPKTVLQVTSGTKATALLPCPLKRCFKAMWCSYTNPCMRSNYSVRCIMAASDDMILWGHKWYNTRLLEVCLIERKVSS